MSTTTQEKFIEALDKIVSDKGLTLAVDSNYANTGVFRVYPRSSFEPMLSLSYSFQSGYASFSQVLPDGRRHPADVEGRDEKLNRSMCRVDEFDAFLQSVIDYLEERLHPLMKIEVPADSLPRR